MNAVEITAWDEDRLELIGLVFDQNTPFIDQVYVGRLTTRGNTTGATIRGSVESESSRPVPTIAASSLDCDKYRKCGDRQSQPRVRAGVQRKSAALPALGLARQHGSG